VHAATRCSLTARRPFYACRAFLDDQLLNVSTHQSTRIGRGLRHGLQEKSQPLRHEYRK